MLNKKIISFNVMLKTNPLYLLILLILLMVTKTISLPKEMLDWLKDRDMSISKVVQRHIRELMEKDASSDV